MHCIWPPQAMEEMYGKEFNGRRIYLGQRQAGLRQVWEVGTGGDVGWVWHPSVQFTSHHSGNCNPGSLQMVCVSLQVRSTPAFTTSIPVCLGGIQAWRKTTESLWWKMDEAVACCLPGPLFMWKLKCLSLTLVWPEQKWNIEKYETPKALKYFFKKKMIAWFTIWSR